MRAQSLGVAEFGQGGQEPVTLSDRFLLGFGGALAGLFTGLLLFVLVNWLMFWFQASAPELKWHFLSFRWVWWITAFCAAFAFIATDSFVRFIGAIWSVLNDLLKFLFS